MDNLKKEYLDLMASQHFGNDTIDDSILRNDIAVLVGSHFLDGIAVSVFDLYRQKHVYESDYHKELFKDTKGKYTEVKVHPADYQQIMKNGIAAFRHLFINSKNARYNKLIREYRALIKGKYQRIIEQISILEFDKLGNIWLALSMVELAPNQSGPFKVNSKIINFKTGDAFSPVDEYFNQKSILSSRETEILKLIATGLLSKEISDKLNISTNTVNTHRQNILHKLNVDTSIEAIKCAENLGII